MPQDPADPTRYDALPVGVLVHREGVIEEVNAAAQELLGGPASRIVGRRMTEFLLRDEAARLLDRYERRRRGERVPAEYECTVVRVDGRHRRVEVNVALRGDHLTVVLRDITERTVDRERRLGLAHLGASLHLHRGEDAVYQALRAGIAEVGLSCVLFDTADGAPVTVFADLPADLRERLRGGVVEGARRRRGRWSPAMEDALRWGEAYVDDVAEEAEILAGAPVGAGRRAVRSGRH
jgi:PAS domain S-box-containing protein